MKLHYTFRKSMMLFIFATLLTAPALAQQGYAVFTAADSTLTFKYGTPAGIPGVNHYQLNINKEPLFRDNKKYRSRSVWDE